MYQSCDIHHARRFYADKLVAFLAEAKLLFRGMKALSFLSLVCTNQIAMLSPVHTGRGGARKRCTQKMEHIVAN